ncbi:hypothetical protein GCM10010401_19530 [Rarobacter faecitabidus]|uniref:ComEC/Rec2 family competence protein n=1 Tax=Rarobacter faecitabidus TaxID=13243 RepID=UPI00147724F0|nr:ComEC/Rec2 family competence protein [Rarobacter faecitabidus]
MGDTANLPAELAESMRVAGLTHLTAVSGAHFAILSALAWNLLGYARLSGRIRGVLILTLIGVLVVLVRPEPSVVRAAAMALIAVVGIMLGRRSSPIPALAVGVIALLMLAPELSLSSGFALSVAATSGLVLIAPLVEARLLWLPAVIRSHLALALSAQVACAPLIVLLSPNLLGWAVVANVIVAPVVPALTLFGAVVVLTAVSAPGIARVAAWLADWCARWIALVADAAAGAPGAELAWLPGVTGAALMAATSAAFVIIVVRAGDARWYAAAYLRPLYLARRHLRAVRRSRVGGGSRVRAGYSRTRTLVPRGVDSTAGLRARARRRP